MKTLGKEKMGRFKVDVELANYDDVVAAKLGQIDAAQVRRVTVQAVVDSGHSAGAASRHREPAWLDGHREGARSLCRWPLRQMRIVSRGCT